MFDTNDTPPIRSCSSTMLRIINVCMYVCNAVLVQKLFSMHSFSHNGQWNAV